MSRRDSDLRRERKKLYRTEEWRQLSAEIWKATKGRCHRCQVRKFNGTEPDGSLHHVVKFAVVWLRTYRPNLVLLCNDCHTYVHSKHNTNREYLSDDEHGIDAAIRRGRDRRNECA